ncbi:hypothetical protein FRC17_000762 [Serendipita sp. 399]|nr:hypothetical protein FRC17_000762 [Serendipita sp. 399]
MKVTNVIYGLVLAPVLLSKAELPPIVATTTFLDELTLGGSGAVRLKIPSNLFYTAYLAETYPNGTKKVGPGASYGINVSHPALDVDGALYLPYNSTISENCVQSSSMGDTYITDLIWVPEVVGNWELKAAIVFFYSSGPQPYRYPNSTLVCIDPPFKGEQTDIATFNVTVRPNGGTSTIDPSTLRSVIIGAHVSTTTIAFPTFTASPSHSWALRSVASNGLPILRGMVVIVLIVSKQFSSKHQRGD